MAWTFTDQSCHTSLQIGTPLPPLEKAKDTGEFKPLWEQEVLMSRNARFPELTYSQSCNPLGPGREGS